MTASRRDEAVPDLDGAVSVRWALEAGGAHNGTATRHGDLPGAPDAPSGHPSRGEGSQVGQEQIGGRGIVVGPRSAVTVPRADGSHVVVIEQGQ